MKFFLILSFLLLSSVSFLYYLLNNQNFLPFDTTGGYNVLNISVFALLATVAFFTLFSIIFAGIALLRYKEESRHKIFLVSLKNSLLLTTLLLLFVFLNFFHILNIEWGGLIVLVVLIAILVI